MEPFPQQYIVLTFVYNSNMGNFCLSYQSINICSHLMELYGPLKAWHGKRFFSLFILTIKILPLGPISSEQWRECNQPWPGVRSEEIMQHSRRHGAPPSSTSNTHCQGSAKLEKSKCPFAFYVLLNSIPSPTPQKKSLFLPNILFILTTEILLFIMSRWNITFKKEMQ